MEIYAIPLNQNCQSVFMETLTVLTQKCKSNQSKLKTVWASETSSLKINNFRLIIKN